MKTELKGPRTLIITVGLPYSGKSTWARQQTFPIVNPDAIRLAMHGQRFASRAEPLVWATAKIMVRALFIAGHEFVILDATNVTHKRRDEWKSEEWDCTFKVFNPGLPTCLARANEAKDTEILPVIDRMYQEYEPLSMIDPVDD